MKQNKFVYGFRYWSGRSTTTSNGKIAGDLVAFKSLNELNQWLNKEDLSSPCGCGGGERVRVSLKKAMSMAGKDEIDFAKISYEYENEGE